ncbi:MAG: amidophosphoribosyltransferase [Planctomycetota bacterium]|jgi:amidophosphoribosyltransferase|nr:amidophosphoribosyltransferase [Planctomycetota bacterium]MDP7255170.1 amidophosphoribosyltransferase [Planctomycetota bacterium]
MGSEIREACGLFGVWNIPDAVELTFKGLFTLQHRGQEGAGIVSSNRERLRIHRGLGLVSEVFNSADLDLLSNPIAIGHVRYSTAGSPTLQNAQPILVDYWRGQVAVAHNGTLVNAQVLRRDFEAAGSIFQTTSDTETIVHLIARPGFNENRSAILQAVQEIKGAFCLLILTPRELVAVRDPHGFRPLCLGMLEGSYVVASETCALDLLGAKFVREIEAGEALFIDDWGLDSRRFGETQNHRAQCIFEKIYFARPDSRLNDESVHLFRQRLGRQLAREHEVDADVVFPVPDSGNSAAQGYALESGIPLDQGFIRNHYVGRTFIDPDAKDRGRKVNMKLNTVEEVIRDKRVIVVDDSVVRGVTTLEKIKQLREVGPKEIHLRVSCPPIKNPCFYGIDFPTKEELIANEREVADIAKMLDVDSMGYLSVEGMLSCVPDEQKDYCHACFSGDYPVQIDPNQTKEMLEHPEDQDDAGL